MSTNEDFGKISTGLAMLSSAVKCGVAWDEHCEKAKTEAFAAIDRLIALAALTKDTRNV